MLISDPEATSRRFSALGVYMTTNVLDGQVFTCGYADACRLSAITDQPRRVDRSALEFYEAQLLHVGPHYDLFEDDRPWRVMCLGMDTGRADAHVSLSRRSAQQDEVMQQRFMSRRGHMRGTTSALRVAYGGSPGRDREGEMLSLVNVPEQVHLMQAYVLANVRMCTVKQPDRTTSYGTEAMARNCFHHLEATMRILQPQLCIVQSSQSVRILEKLLADRVPITDNLDLVEVGGSLILWAKFTHPSVPNGTQNWGTRDSTSYLDEVVVPTIRAAREYGLA
ncbi:hypothetical protein ACL02S_22215 [Nocardia sp. 004]|uniref:hypothetical protein n=1 Tax=Nocardia sp. 004 TaxID=3385978 RepID=UPI0039A1E34D